MFSKLKKKILVSIVIAGIVYLTFALYADYQKVIDAFSNFNWLLLPLLLILSLFNYITRYFKWDYYLSVINVKIKKVDSLLIFMSGLIMSITPGKVGELLKSYLVKEVTNTPISKTAPVIFAERITDFISLLLITIIGAYTFDYGLMPTIVISVFFIILILILSNKKISLKILSSLEKLSFLRKHLINIHLAYESAYQLLRPIPLLKMTVISIIAWGFECLGYYIILLNFHIEFGLFWASFSYAFAIIAGAISMLPGGLGVTEGSLTYLLIQKGIADNVAVATTFIVRVVTLWFAVLVGIASVSFYQKRFGKINSISVNNL
ncbi:MAG: flippase-like domain-containing protein [Bacteroidetes bacterium]|nr:flippase-like domain-containing protein [Bacteroidota bacterium]MCH7770461.1 flippase-like domain-containing protein [Bacteroidota bacterium]